MSLAALHHGVYLLSLCILRASVVNIKNTCTNKLRGVAPRTGLRQGSPPNALRSSTHPGTSFCPRLLAVDDYLFPRLGRHPPFLAVLPPPPYLEPPQAER